MSVVAGWILSSEQINFYYNSSLNVIQWTFSSGSYTTATFAGDDKTHYMQLRVVDNNFTLQSNTTTGTDVGRTFSWGGNMSPSTFKTNVLPYLPFYQAGGDEDEGDCQFRYIAYEFGSIVEDYWLGVYSDDVPHYYRIYSNSSVPLEPTNTPTFTATFNCSGGTTPVWQIEVTNATHTNVSYYSIRKATGLTSTYTEVTKLYVSGGTFTYNDSTGVNGYYKVYAVNMPWEVVSTTTEEISFDAVIEASVIWGDYPTLTFTANTINYCGQDNVLWFLDGVLTGATTGATFTGLLPTETEVYKLTAKFLDGGITGNTSNEIELIFFNTGTSLQCFIYNDTISLSGHNRMEYLIVAGGGGGAGANGLYGGGGGAGGMLEGTVNNPVNNTYSVVVGTGGAAGSKSAPYGTKGTNGGNSSFYGLIASGGGGGAAFAPYPAGNAGNGGSGGGGGQTTSYGTGVSGQGYRGGSGSDYYGTAGGGGGKSAQGGNAGVSNGNGGAGKSNDISGSAITYATGGDAGKTTPIAGVDGRGDGGDGANGMIAGGRNGADGGDGIVCVYLWSYYPQKPVAPTNLAATLIDCDSLKLTWTNNDITEVTAIHVQQYSGSTWVTIHDVAYNVNNYTVTGLTPLTNYQFRVVPYNDLFTTPSDSVYPTTLDATPYAVYGYATNLTAPFIWSINDTGYGTAIYPMIRVSGDTAWITGATLSHNATSYTFTGLSFNNDYEVQIVRTSTDGSYASDIFEFSTNDFVAPTLNGYLTGNDVTLEILDFNVNREDYEIYRDIGGTGFTLIATISGTTGITTYTDNNIASGVTYTYKVRSKLTSFSPVVYSDYSNTVYVKIVIIYGATGLTASNIGYTGLTLTWVNNNTGNTSGNHVQQFSGGTWVDIAAVSSATTTYDVTGLTPNTGYYFRIETYNGLQTVYSPILYTSTLNPTPFGLTATTITLFYQDLTWNLLTPAFGDYIRVEYRLCSGGAWTTYSTIAYDDTTETLSGLTMGECYEIRIVTHSNTFGDYPSTLFELNIPAPNYPSPFCDGTNYSYTGSTCGNSGGSITITVQEYLIYYDFVLTDIFGNTYTLVLDTYSNLPAGYYFLSATAKDAYKWYYGYDACTEVWIEITDSDNPLSLVSLKIKPAQCLSFDVQYGRIYYEVTGLTSGHTYSFWAFSSDLSLFYSVTGVTATTGFIINNASAGCYWVIIKDEVSNCVFLIPDKCITAIAPFSLSGIKKIWIAPWSSDLDYNYWKDSDEDYFLEFEDTTFFNSTKIKEYLSLTGGTTGVTWYSLPLAHKYVQLSQKLVKVRQGFLFQDALTIAITKATAAKWVHITNIINPENRWIYVVQDTNNYYWTGGYYHGAGINTYSFATGKRGEDDGYRLTIACESENKLLTSLDEDYVTTYIE